MVSIRHRVALAGTAVTLLLADTTSTFGLDETAAALPTSSPCLRFFPVHGHDTTFFMIDVISVTPFDPIDWRES